MSRQQHDLVSIVIPCYNEEPILPMLRERLSAILDGDSHGSWECVLVDDGSTDITLELARQWYADDPRIVVVALSRNFGHQGAICAGMEEARGEAVITMDADLQDPPELIPEMVTKWKEGYDVVYARRATRHGEGPVKTLTARIFYRLLRALAGTWIPEDVGDFRLLSRRAADAVQGLPESNRFLRGLVAWIGFRHAVVEFDRPPRAAGRTKYGMAKMLALALDAITAFSTTPLRLISYTGLAAMAVGFSVAVWAVWARHSIPDMQRGWASLMVAVCVLQGITLLCIGVVGEYLGRVLIETKRRPTHVVQEVLSRRRDEVTT